MQRASSTSKRLDSAPMKNLPFFHTQARRRTEAIKAALKDSRKTHLPLKYIIYMHNKITFLHVSSLHSLHRPAIKSAAISEDELSDNIYLYLRFLNESWMSLRLCGRRLCVNSFIFQRMPLFHAATQGSAHICPCSQLTEPHNYVKLATSVYNNVFPYFNGKKRKRQRCSKRTYKKNPSLPLLSRGYHMSNTLVRLTRLV